jgi:translation initiation factor SUI1
LDLRRILQTIQKVFKCGGHIVSDNYYGDIIQLTGDQRDNAYNFLISEEITVKNNIKVHGY